MNSKKCVAQNYSSATLRAVWKLSKTGKEAQTWQFCSPRQCAIIVIFTSSCNIIGKILNEKTISITYTYVWPKVLLVWLSRYFWWWQIRSALQTASALKKCAAVSDDVMTTMIAHSRGKENCHFYASFKDLPNLHTACRVANEWVWEPHYFLNMFSFCVSGLFGVFKVWLSQIYTCFQIFFATLPLHTCTTDFMSRFSVSTCLMCAVCSVLCNSAHATWSRL
jgi:hypothetical protein